MLLAPAIVAFDAPTKIESEGGSTWPGWRRPDRRCALVAQAIRNAQSDLVVVSPYLIPGTSGVEALTAFVDRGVRVRLMTNSLAATDERLVHVGYRQYRVDMLRAGAELYEWSPAQGGRVMREIVAGGTVLRLHAKCAVIDRRRVYLGSMNFDPRSRDWNTEFGLLIDSPGAGRAGARLDRRGAAARGLSSAPGRGRRIAALELGQWRWRRARLRTGNRPEQPHPAGPAGALRAGADALAWVLSSRLRRNDKYPFKSNT
jgi:phosphatidylserine/phosphatidylglycerophosphate/cardiolipin synthase-like enzyme